jgi:hypothetical protein
MLHCRLSRDYEGLPARSEAMFHRTAIDLMSRRLINQNTPTWPLPAGWHAASTSMSKS